MIKINMGVCMNSTGISKTLSEQILHIILEQKSVEKVILFGSRSKGHGKKTSDIDLAILGDNWSSTNINLAHPRLEEDVHTACTFDVLLANQLHKESLLKDIEQGVVLYDQSQGQ